jgi:hypothetical protein
MQPAMAAMVGSDVQLRQLSDAPHSSTPDLRGGNDNVDTIASTTIRSGTRCTAYR